MDSWFTSILTSWLLIIIGACTVKYLFDGTSRKLTEDHIDSKKGIKEMSGRSKLTKANSSKKQYDSTAASSLFDSICEEDDKEIATMEGIMKLGEMIGIDASTDIRMLVILWKFEAKTKPGCITRSEFLGGMESSYITDAKGLETSLYTFDPGFLETAGWIINNYHYFIFIACFELRLFF